MNFRLPFQISRVSAICPSSSAVKLISKFTPIYGNHVKNQNKDNPNNAHHAWIITKKCTYSPFNIYQQKAFIHDIRDTEQAVRERVRYEQNCDNQCDEEPELVFRQTIKTECCPCSQHKPYRAPPLVRPLKLYDDSQCVYDHICKPEVCVISRPTRMDNVCGHKVVRMRLPPLPLSECCFCVNSKPVISPILGPPLKLYDPDKMKRVDHATLVEHKKCVRMDEVRGYKVKQKNLPVIPLNNCKKCQKMKALTAPLLLRPVLRYDPICVPFPHSDRTPIEKCPPPRRDSLCREPIFRELPPSPCSDCEPCQSYIPTICPCLKRLNAGYDPTEMEHDHKRPETPCDTPALRRDIISVTLTRKKLPPICRGNECTQCMEHRPLTAPVLERPTCFNCNMEEEQKRDYSCIETKCVRRDGNITILPRRLPPVPKGNCQQGLDKIRYCILPKLEPLTKLYDDTKCKYRHVCVPDPCLDNPPRLDDTCYTYIRKRLPVPPNSPDCKPCGQRLKDVPKLCRLRKSYDDTKQKFRHPICPEDVCKVIPRADNITGITDEVKSLQTYRPLTCKPCMPYLPCKGPILRRPRARYDDSCMVYEKCQTSPRCEEAKFRRDFCLLEKSKKLPIIKSGSGPCKLCQQQKPTFAPPLCRPKKLYEFPSDPCRYKECPEECVPRRDDLLCWKPRPKKLPSFKECCQCCYYSTISRNDITNNIKHPIGSENKIKTTLKQNFSTNPVSIVTALPEEQKLYKSKNVIKKNCLDGQRKQISESAIKTNDTQSGSRYYVLKKPTWKCINVSERQTINDPNIQKKYDYSVEKWLKEGTEHLVQTSKSNSYKSNPDHLYNVNTKYTAVSECVTPVKFTGYDTSLCNEYFCIKKNKKLQPLRIGSAFSTTKKLQTPNNVSCKKTHFKTSAMRVSRDININLNTDKIATSVLKETKNHPFPTIIEEHIKKHITPGNVPTSNFILNLNNKMRSMLFQKMSKIFKLRENAARCQKIRPDTHKNGPNLRKKINKMFLMKLCEKYDMELDSNKLKTDTNKPNILQKLRSQDIRTKMSKPMGSSNNVETCNRKVLPKNVKVMVDQTRNFSTISKRGQLCYKRIDISENYMAKIYKVKLKKIGVKNLMLEKNDPDKFNEAPHTICYICKVVPRYQPIYDDEPADLGDVKINYYREKRNTID